MLYRGCEPAARTSPALLPGWVGATFGESEDTMLDGWRASLDRLRSSQAPVHRNVRVQNCPVPSSSTRPVSYSCFTAARTCVTRARPSISP